MRRGDIPTVADHLAFKQMSDEEKRVARVVIGAEYNEKIDEITDLMAKAYARLRELRRGE